VGGGPLSTGQAIEGDAAGAEAEFWAEATEAAVETRTERSNNRIIRGVYNQCGRLLFPKPESGYVRVGGNPPATQESAFQWIENFSMSA
jgi:hypothetical protein